MKNTHDTADTVISTLLLIGFLLLLAFITPGCRREKVAQATPAPTAAPSSIQPLMSLPAPEPMAESATPVPEPVPTPSPSLSVRYIQPLATAPVEMKLVSMKVEPQAAPLPTMLPTCSESPIAGVPTCTQWCQQNPIQCRRISAAEICAERGADAGERCVECITSPMNAGCQQSRNYYQ